LLDAYVARDGYDPTIELLDGLVLILGGLSRSTAAERS
jgi:hypothetical protein